jgi:DNA-directed RNA polymerase subunit B"/DNA-directed RNA polymerase subunit B
MSMTENNWKLVDAFFDKYDLVDHHIKSYNDFVNNRIQNIIDITDPISLDDGKYTLKTEKFALKNHQIKKLMVLEAKLTLLKQDLEI